MTINQTIAEARATHEQWRNMISKGSHTLSIDLTKLQLDILVSYIDQLVKWNKAYKLLGFDPNKLSQFSGRA